VHWCPSSHPVRMLLDLRRSTNTGPPDGLENLATEG
jgi:hypothetical protein